MKRTKNAGKTDIVYIIDDKTEFILFSYKSLSDTLLYYRTSIFHSDFLSSEQQKAVINLIVKKQKVIY